MIYSLIFIDIKNPGIPLFIHNFSPIPELIIEHEIMPHYLTKNDIIGPMNEDLDDVTNNFSPDGNNTHGDLGPDSVNYEEKDNNGGIETPKNELEEFFSTEEEITEQNEEPETDIDLQGGMKDLNYMEDENYWVFEEYFNTIEQSVKMIIKESKSAIKEREFTLIRVIGKYNLIFYYYGMGEFLICAINDLDDDKEKILGALYSLSRRFYQKHRTTIQEFRYSNQSRLFNSFAIDCRIITLNGKIGENYPVLTVHENVLDRLLKMSVITKEEYIIAKKCKESKTPYALAKELKMDYDCIKEALDKLKNLDLLRERPSFIQEQD